MMEVSFRDPGAPRNPAGTAGARSSRLVGAFGRVFNPLLLLIVLAGLWANGTWRSNPEPVAPALPPLARQRIETQGGIVASLAFHPDGHRLVWADSLKGRVGTWDPERGRSLLSERSALRSRDVRRLALAPNGRTLAAADRHGGIMVWDRGLEDRPLSLPPESWVARTLTFASDGTRLVAGGDDGTVRTWDTAAWRELHAWSAQGESITCIDITPDGESLVVGGSRGWVRGWKIDGTGLIAEWVAHESAVIAIAHSPDGRTLASAGWDGRVRLWDATTGRGGRALPMEDRNIVDCLAYSADGSILATGDSESAIGLWDAETGRLFGRLAGHRGPVRSLAFSPDGRTLASGASDGAIVVWDVAAAGPAALRAARPPARRSPWPPAAGAGTSRGRKR